MYINDSVRGKIKNKSLVGNRFINMRVLEKCNYQMKENRRMKRSYFSLTKDRNHRAAHGHLESICHLFTKKYFICKVIDKSEILERQQTNC